MITFTRTWFVATAAWTLALCAPIKGAEALRIQAPDAVPRGVSLGAYSPHIAFAYSGLAAGSYSIRVWLLEEEDWHCASSQWCERTFAVGHPGADMPNGVIHLAPPFDVFDYGPELTWVARLFNTSGREVASATGTSATVQAEPPLLKAIGKRRGVVGKELRLAFSLVNKMKENIRFRVEDSPPGASLDLNTGIWKWTPDESGLFRIIVQSIDESTGLTDAEIVSLEIDRAQQAEEKADSEAAQP